MCAGLSEVGDAVHFSMSGTESDGDIAIPPSGELARSWDPERPDRISNAQANSRKTVGWNIPVLFSEQ